MVGLAGVLSIQLGSLLAYDLFDRISQRPLICGRSILRSITVFRSRNEQKTLEDRVHIEPDHVAMSQADIP